MKATETTVLKFIGGWDKVFIIPPFQRNYEWTEDECSELFADILAVQKTNRTHYLGNIVYYVGENDGASYDEFILVDGQQRVTTILLLLCALRDSMTDASTIDSINKRYLKNDSNNDRFRVRLKQTSYDAKSFISIVDGTPTDNDDNHVTQNYYHFMDLIAQCGVAPELIYETIPNLEVVDVNLKIDNNLSAVQTIFEKINSTGKPLSAADLIRNFLLLSGNAYEQEKLYVDYWVKIENLISNPYISRFARDYLIMTTMDEIPEKKIYKIFKEYFVSTGTKNVDVLKSMHRYAKFYAWLKFENSPNEKLNRLLQRLNVLKTDDLYPLYLYLLERTYEADSVETLKIFRLLSNFMLRYRIVAPSGGGGALRSIVQQLLEGLSSNTIECTYDALLFELSNSTAPTGRFPTDEEFTTELMKSVNINYARAVLMEIEEFESKNIPVPYEKITVEHIMPQSLSDWWRTYLGGEDEATRIFDTYLNCIGNLAPISQGYNAKMSNRPWNEKLPQLARAQFEMTAELANYSSWKETDIMHRNADIAKRACVATISPLDRTRKYQTKSMSTDFIPGVYSLADVTTPMTGATLSCMIYNGQHTDISTWKELLAHICAILHRIDAQLFAQIVDENKIHKATSKKNFPLKDPIISKDANLLVSAKEIKGTHYFSEGTISSSRVRVYVKQLLGIYGILDEFAIAVNE